MKTKLALWWIMILILPVTVWLIVSRKNTGSSPNNVEMSGPQVFSPKQNIVPTSKSDEVGGTSPSPNLLDRPFPIPKSSNIPDAKEWGLLLNRAGRGDVEARDKLMVLATDRTLETTSRETAIRMLGRSGDAKSIGVIFDLLADEDGSIRTAAFYSLPEEKRPRDFDYTVQPTVTSREQIERIKNETLK